MPANMASRPSRTTSRGEAPGKYRGMPTAAASKVIDSGMIFRPVSIADRPSATDRYSGITKNSPAWIRNWKKNMMSPPLSCGIRNIDIWISGSRPSRSRRCSHSANSHSTKSPDEINTIVGETPPIDGPSGFGRMNPHSLERSTPNTISPSPAADKIEPTPSRCGRVSTGASWIRRDRSKITMTTRTSPANTHRQDA